MEASKPTETMDSAGPPMSIPPGPATGAPAQGAGRIAVDEGTTAPLPVVGTDSSPAHAVTVTPSLAPSGADRCPVCGAGAAPDQRYCVECGQRLAHARPVLMGAPAAAGSGGPAEPPRRSRFQIGPNGTLIAGIATLLLAMGVGVVIGRLDNGSSSKTTPTYIPTVVSSAGSGAAASTEQAAASAATPAKKAATTTAKGSSKAPSATAVKPTNPTVKIGSKGHGAGYQHGHFTGHFFGEENEAESGESSTNSKGKK